jgi:chemotaxis protein MotD
MPRVSRPAPSDRAPSPFESLIDDTAQPAAEPAPKQPESKVAKGDDKQAPEKSEDCKTAEANDNTKPADTDDVTAADEAPADGSTPIVDGKKIAKSESVSDVGDTIQPESGHEPAAGQKTDNATTTTPADGVAIVSADAIPIVQTPAQAPNEMTDDGKAIEQPLQQLALVTDGAPKITQLGADLPKAVVGKTADNGKTKHVDADDEVKTNQPTDETDDAFQILNKDAAPKHAESKAQTETGDGDKQNVSQGRGDFITASHRSDAGLPTPPPGNDVSAAAKMSNDVPTQTQIPGGTSHASQNAAAPATLVSQTGPQPVAVPLSGVAIEIAGKALAGKNRFEIRLDPPELGRIDVRLDVDRDGNVTSRLTVDRQDTLDLLRRDAGGLERALQDAGLKTANNGLQFSLRDQSMNEQQAGTSPGAAVLVATDESLPSLDVIPQRHRLAGLGGGLDIRV